MDANLPEDGDYSQANSPLIQEPLQADFHTRSKVFVGTCLMGLGFGVLALAAIDLSIGLPFRMPHYWYPMRLLWALSGTAVGLFGSRVVAISGNVTDWAPRRAGRRFQRVVLYTRQECHLCDAAGAVLEQYHRYLPPVEEVDIDKDAVLIAKFTTCVPVVEIDGQVRFRGRVDQILLRRLIEGTAPQG